MNVNDFVNGLNELYQENKLEEVEKWLEFWEVQAREKRDLGVLLVVLNEKMNYCKGIDDLEKVLARQQELQAKGKHVFIAELMVQMGIIKEKDMKRITVWICE